MIVFVLAIAGRPSGVKQSKCPSDLVTLIQAFFAANRHINHFVLAN
jgi:hypothetical protein